MEITIPPQLWCCTRGRFSYWLRNWRKVLLFLIKSKETFPPRSWVGRLNVISSKKRYYYCNSWKNNFAKILLKKYFRQSNCLELKTLSPRFYLLINFHENCYSTTVSARISIKVAIPPQHWNRRIGTSPTDREDPREEETNCVTASRELSLVINTPRPFLHSNAALMREKRASRIRLLSGIRRKWRFLHSVPAFLFLPSSPPVCVTPFK